MRLNELFESLQSNCGIEDLAPDEDGVYSLVHEGTSIQVFPIDEGAKALLYAPVTDVPEVGAGELAQIILQVNHLYKGGSGASFSIDPTSNRVCLQQLVDCETLGYEGFAGALLNLINQTKDWKVKIDQFESKETGGDEGMGSATAGACEPVQIPNNWLSA